MPPVSITFSGDTLAEALAAAALACGAPAVPAADAAPTAPKPAARKRAAPEAIPTAPAAPVAAPKTPEAPAAAAPDLKKVAIGKLVTLINANDALGRNGKQVCTDLCKTFGGANISQIDPSKYPAVIAKVEQELEALNSDPTA